MVQDEKHITCTSESEPDESLEPPPSKRPNSQVWNTYTEILQESGAHVIEENRNDELEIYMAEHLVPIEHDSCYKWWANNCNRSPCMAKLAIKYLSAPPTSVQSERLFSVASHVYDEKRNRLAPEKAEMLLFIKSNFKFCNI